MDLIVLPERLKLRKEHGFSRQPAATRFENHVPGSEPLQYQAPPNGAKSAGALCWQAVVQLQL
jgi:hypothetical protein